MNLFIETPQRAADRLERERRLAHGAAAASALSGAAPGIAANPSAAFDLDEPDSDGPVPHAGGAFARQPYSVAQDAYQRERAFDRKRARTRKATALVKMLLFVALLPVALVTVFVAAYALACIANGASPEELLELLAALFERMGGFVAGALRA